MEHSADKSGIPSKRSYAANGTSARRWRHLPVSPIPNIRPTSVNVHPLGPASGGTINLKVQKLVIDLTAWTKILHAEITGKISQ